MTSTPTRQPLPRTPEAARTEREWWELQVRLARIKAEVAQRELDLAKNDLDVVKGIAAGEFSDDPPIREEVGFYSVRPVREHCASSRGPWSWAL